MATKKRVIHKPKPAAKPAAAANRVRKAPAKPKPAGTAALAAAEFRKARGGRPDVPAIDGETRMLALDHIDSWPALNPRRTFEPEALAELSQSIADRGLLQNLVVAPDPATDGHWLVVAGERRWRALWLLADSGRWDAAAPLVPCRIACDTPDALRALAILENLQRQDLTPLDEAGGFQALAAAGWSTVTIAERIRRTPRYVQQRLALVTRLGPEAQAALAEGHIDVTRARALTLVHDPKEQARRAKELVSDPFKKRWDAAQIEVDVLQKLPRVGTELFTLAEYTGEIHDVPAGYGQPYRVFLDAGKFWSLQNDAVKQRRNRLAKEWSWVEIRKGYRSDYAFDRSTDATAAGAVLWVSPTGKVEESTGLVKRENAPPSAGDSATERAIESVARAARAASAPVFVAALADRLAADPGAAHRLLLHEMLYGDAGLSGMWDKGTEREPGAAFDGPIEAVHAAIALFVAAGVRLEEWTDTIPQPLVTLAASWGIPLPEGWRAAGFGPGEDAADDDDDATFTADEIAAGDAGARP